MEQRVQLKTSLSNAIQSWSGGTADADASWHHRPLARPPTDPGLTQISILQCVEHLVAGAEDNLAAGWLKVSASRSIAWSLRLAAPAPTAQPPQARVIGPDTDVSSGQRKQHGGRIQCNQNKCQWDSRLRR